MKSIIVSIAVVAGLTFAGSSMSADMPPLAKKNGCANCHAIDKEVVGPAWSAVAEKYEHDADATAELSTKIAKGSGGVWGDTPMPAQKKVSEADIKELVAFILRLAK